MKEDKGHREEEKRNSVEEDSRIPLCYEDGKGEVGGAVTAGKTIWRRGKTEREITLRLLKAMGKYIILYIYIKYIFIYLYITYFRIHI